MPNTTGGLITRNYQSASNGSRTLGSILASSGGGAGSPRRVYNYYQKNGNIIQFYQNVFGLKYGQYGYNPQLVLTNNY